MSMDPDATVMVPTPGRRRPAVADAGAADAGVRPAAPAARELRAEAPVMDVGAFSGLNPLLGGLGSSDGAPGSGSTMPGALEATEGMAGQDGQCPTCGNNITIPILDRYGRLTIPH